MAFRKQRITPSWRAVDRALFKAVKLVELNEWLVPLNMVQEEKRFFQAIKRGGRYQPVFRYPQLNTRMKDIHFLARGTRLPVKTLQNLYEKKQEELLIKWRMLRSVGTGHFTKWSQQLYGQPPAKTLTACRALMRRPISVRFKEPVKPERVRRELARFMRKKKLVWKARISRKLSSKVAVRSVDRTLLIHGRLPFGKNEIERLKIHEVETHIFRGENGRRQPYKIFQIGLAGYALTEEGLAVALEERGGKLDPWQKHAYAARCVAVHLAQSRSFYSLFTYLASRIPEDLAFRITTRAKRGLVYTEEAGGLTKDHHYMTGRDRVQMRLKKRRDWEAVFSGKVGLGDLQMVQDLMRQNIISPPHYRPRLGWGHG